MKRFLLCAFAVLLILSVVGCGQLPQNESSNDAESTASTESVVSAKNVSSEHAALQENAVSQKEDSAAQSSGHTTSLLNGTALRKTFWTP